MNDVIEQVEKFNDFIDQNYRDQINQAILTGKKFLLIDFSKLAEYDHQLADQLLDEPEETIKAFELSLENFEIDRYLRIRFFNLPVNQKIKIKDVRSEHLGQFLIIEGIVRQASDVRPQVTSAKFECPSCGNSISILQLDAKFKEPYRCTCGKKGRFRLLSKELVDAQRLVLEESPDSLQGGEQPKRLSIFLKEDLVEPIMERKTTPGSKVRVNGVVKEVPILLRTGAASTKYDLMMDSNFIEPLEETFEELIIDKEEEEKIISLSKNPKIYDKFIGSIAPSIYGHADIKEALSLQLMGGVRKERKDGTWNRGDIHILLVGDPGSSKCVKGDTKVILKDGSIKEIKYLVDENLNNFEKCDDGVFNKTNFSLSSLGFDYRNYTGLCNAVWKRKAPEFLYKIITETGNEITVSPTHPMFLTENGIVFSKRSEELKKGDFIASPRNLKLNTEFQKIDFDIERTSAHNGTHIKIPKFCSPELARLLGYLTSETYMNYEETTGRTAFTNEDKILLDDYSFLVKKIFNIEPRFKKPRKGKIASELDVSSIEFLRFFEKIEPSLIMRAKHKQVPKIIQKSPNSIVKEFLKSYFDGEATVVEDKREVKVSSASKDLIYDLKTLLLRFNIISQTHKTIACATNTKAKIKRPYWILTVSGKEVLKYSSKIGFNSSEKQRKLINSINNPDQTYNTNIDVIPGLPKILKSVRKKLKLTQFEFGIPRTTYQHFERGDRNPSRNSLRKILTAVSERYSYLISVLKKQEFDSKSLREDLYTSQATLANSVNCSQTLISHYELEKIRPVQQSYINESLLSLIKGIVNDFALKQGILRLYYLAYSSIFWDKIQSVEKIKSEEEFVYDLTVDKVHNFVANNFYCHNSSLLMYMSKVAPKARYVSGKSASAAGLTGAIVKDEFLKGWALEGGAMALANGGAIFLDELDKMDEDDTSALHEGLEQQQISFSKANIQATLLTRVSALAAANPKLGRFDPYQPIAAQINLPPALINRFDLIFPMRDIPDEKLDAKIATHILDVHGNTGNMEPDIEPSLLRKYVSYAKNKVFPKLSDVAKDEIRNFYVSIRNSGSSKDDVKPIPISARQLEALIRLSEASAKIRLSNKITKDDAKRAIRILKKCLYQVGIDPQTGKLDVDVLATGITTSQRNKIIVVREVIYEFDKNGIKTIPVNDIISVCREKGLEESVIDEVLEKMKREGEIFQPKVGFISKI